MSSQIQNVQAIYARLEPPGVDAWNPLRNEIELWHRSRLLLESCRAFRKIPAPIDKLKILDVGCGVGRSSRLFVELGAWPENILGIDCRESAIDLARKLNPGIQFAVKQSLAEWPVEGFDLCSQCTVFSSILGVEAREETARQMERAVGANGLIFWWDLLQANSFAGGDALDPRRLFPERPLLYYHEIPVFSIFAEAIRPLRGCGPYVARLLQRFGHSPTHLAALFGPKKMQPC